MASIQRTFPLLLVAFALLCAPTASAAVAYAPILQCKATGLEVVETVCDPAYIAICQVLAGAAELHEALEELYIAWCYPNTCSPGLQYLTSDPYGMAVSCRPL